MFSSNIGNRYSVYNNPYTQSTKSTDTSNSTAKTSNNDCAVWNSEGSNGATGTKKSSSDMWNNYDDISAETAIGDTPSAEQPETTPTEDQETSTVENNTPEVAQQEAPTVENNTPEVTQQEAPATENNAPEVVQQEAPTTENNTPEVVQQEAPTTENNTPEVAQQEAPTTENNTPKVVQQEAPTVENNTPEVVQQEASTTENITPEVAQQETSATEKRNAATPKKPTHSTQNKSVSRQSDNTQTTGTFNTASNVGTNNKPSSTTSNPFQNKSVTGSYTQANAPAQSTAFKDSLDTASTISGDAGYATDTIEYTANTVSRYSTGFTGKTAGSVGKVAGTVGKGVGTFGAVVSGAKAGYNAVDAYDAYQKGDMETAQKKGLAAAEDTVDAVTGVASFSNPAIAFGVNVGAKGALRTGVEMYNKGLENAYSDDDTGLKVLKSAKSAAEVQYTAMNHSVDVVAEEVEGVFGKNVVSDTLHGAANINRKVMKETDEYLEDAYNDGVVNATKKHAKKAYNAAADTYKEVKQESKNTMKSVAKSKPVQTAKNWVEDNVPGGKTMVNQARKIYNWFTS